MTPATVPATIAHAEVLAGLFAQGGDGTKGWSTEAMAVTLGTLGVFGFIASLDEGDKTPLKKPVGFILVRALVSTAEAEVLQLAVQPAARRRGVARALLDAMLDKARALGAEHCFLEVAEDNAPAIALYRGAGFVEAGVRDDYYRRKDGAGVDAKVLVLKLA